MPKWLGLIVQLAVSLGILTFSLTVFLWLGAKPPIPVRAEDDGFTPLVETEVVSAHNGDVEVHLDGVAVPFREIELSAEVAGRIIKKSPSCRTGRYVTKGTVLIEIDQRDYQFEVDRLEQQLDQAQVMLDELKVELENTVALTALAEEEIALQKQELKRVLDLGKRGVITDSEVDQTRRSELTARNAKLRLDNERNLLNTRRNRLIQAEELVRLQLEQAKVDLGRTQIRAPVDGVVVQELAEVDAFVQRGTALVKIEDTSSIEVKCNLKMEELSWLWNHDASHTSDEASPVSLASGYEPPNGTESGPTTISRNPETPAPLPVDLGRDYTLPQARVSIRYRLGGFEYTWDGVLSRYDGIGVDERTRMVPCLIFVENPHPSSVRALSDSTVGRPGLRALTRGMFVEVAVHVTPRRTLLKLSERAVRPGNVVGNSPRGEFSKVWRVRDGKLDVLQVEIARQQADGVLVRADSEALKAGDHVVVSPLSVVTSGMSVRERIAETKN